ncbi:hypothetical protein [Streptomyces sp. NPDC020742]|uniref:hypothetical protein n=1 Tax=unclassified Streptomyces TaxID=2593676 RepID=UPI0033F86B9E
MRRVVALIEPVIASWKARHPSVSGHQGTRWRREIVNALPCQSRTAVDQGFKTVVICREDRPMLC